MQWTTYIAADVRPVEKAKGGSQPSWPNAIRCWLPQFNKPSCGEKRLTVFPRESPTIAREHDSVRNQKTITRRKDPGPTEGDLYREVPVGNRSLVAHNKITSMKAL
mmetsp:Transcript_24669/g.57924  ORF Transcript_24669/g.57924 Transcript_24669/m.57924 type:complete len:106 (-) Transcript_24669:6-323(-)